MRSNKFPAARLPRQIKNVDDILAEPRPEPYDLIGMILPGNNRRFEARSYPVSGTRAPFMLCEISADGSATVIDTFRSRFDCLEWLHQYARNSLPPWRDSTEPGSSLRDLILSGGIARAR